MRTIIFLLFLMWVPTYAEESPAPPEFRGVPQKGEIDIDSKLEAARLKEAEAYTDRRKAVLRREQELATQLKPKPVETRTQRFWRQKRDELNRARKGQR